MENLDLIEAGVTRWMKLEENTTGAEMKESLRFGAVELKIEYSDLKKGQDK